MRVHPGLIAVCLVACGSTTGNVTATTTTSATPTTSVATTVVTRSPYAPPPTGTVASLPLPPSPANGSGIYGTVTAGPTCPVERPGQPCPPRPVSGTVEAQTAAGATVASAPTASDGSYRLTLQPGRYTLVVVTGSMLPRCTPQPVSVPPSSAVRADISCDTGIR